MMWPADLEPELLRQPDRLSCGAASVLAARALTSAWRPRDPASEIRDEHRALTSSRSPRDRFQVPWPRRLGTPPWAVANALRALTGRHIATVNARPRPAIGYEVLVEQLEHRPVAVYVGSRWLPRHVVVAVTAVGGGVQVFDPGRGRLVQVPRRRWVEHDLELGGWSHLWFVV